MWGDYEYECKSNDTLGRGVECYGLGPGGDTVEKIVGKGTEYDDVGVTEGTTRSLSVPGRRPLDVNGEGVGPHD